MDVTTEQPHSHTEPIPDQEHSNHINSLEVSGSTIVIQFINESKDANIIHDIGTLRYLIRNSPFAGAIDGDGRCKFSTHEYIVNIKNNKDIQDTNETFNNTNKPQNNTIYTKKDQQQLKENQTDISKTMNLANPDTQKKQSKDESFQCRLGNCEICQNRQ